MVKNAIKKIKKAKTEVLEKSTEDKKSEPRINLKQDLVRENAYISDILGLVNFPKRDDSDDDETGKNFLVSLSTIFSLKLNFCRVC